MAEASTQQEVSRIEVRVQVGDKLLSPTDDPVYLGLRGAAGREFRLELARGRAHRRGAEDHFVIGAPDDPATNVDHPELNDPMRPALDARTITGCYLRKGFEPIPNVRAVGEMDDRIEVLWAEVEVHRRGGGAPLRFVRHGPIWLGLLCGVFLEIPPVSGEG